MNMFRTLRADEIDCRIAQIKENGLSLLLYKDARCDQNILDEVVGPFNWKREHTRDNKNCIVSIKNPETGEWISKEDTGTESNTEKEKGLASDSFKRACFNWGIGRELYTAPFIWIGADKCNIKDNRGRMACYDRFTVKGIGYTDGVITGLEIKNQATGKICYKWGEIKEEAPDKPEKPDDEPEKIVIPDIPGTVSTASKIPAGDSFGRAVSDAFGDNMNEFMERMEITDSKEALKRFNELRKKLFDAGIIKNIGKMKSAEEVDITFNAIYANLTPAGELK